MTASAVRDAYQVLSARLAPLAAGILQDVPAVEAIYNPLEYAALPWNLYLERYITAQRRVLFLGMNPGPWGMAQTGIPFGEVSAVRDWMEIEAPVGAPDQPHSARPVEGFQCARSEVSGRRLWALMRQRFGTAAAFFQDHAVLNYCPLVFMGERGGNITPDRLPAHWRRAVEDPCNDTLQQVIEILDPRYLVGVGGFATARLRRVAPQRRVVQILHPSPASPAANKGWADTATGQLEDAGIW